MFYNKRGCTYCSQSAGAKLIENYLLNNNYDYLKEYSFDDCRHKNKLRFDFAVFKSNQLYCLIEYDGEHHFKPINLFGGEELYEYYRKLDVIKNNYCLGKGIRLLRIRELQNLEVYLQHAFAMLDNNGSFLAGGSARVLRAPKFVQVQKFFMVIFFPTWAGEISVKKCEKRHI